MLASCAVWFEISQPFFLITTNHSNFVKTYQKNMHQNIFRVNATSYSPHHTDRLPHRHSYPYSKTVLETKQQFKTCFPWKEKSIHSFLTFCWCLFNVVGASLKLNACHYFLPSCCNHDGSLCFVTSVNHATMLSNSRKPTYTAFSKKVWASYRERTQFKFQWFFAWGVIFTPLNCKVKYTYDNELEIFPACQKLCLKMPRYCK